MALDPIDLSWIYHDKLHVLELVGSNPWVPRIARCKHGLQITRLAAATGARTRVHGNARPTHCLCGHSGYFNGGMCSDMCGSLISRGRHTVQRMVQPRAAHRTKSGTAEGGSQYKAWYSWGRHTVQMMVQLRASHSANGGSAEGGTQYKEWYSRWQHNFLTTMKY